MILSLRQLKFLEFVQEQHGEQKRKYTLEPYWTHPLEVANMVVKYDHTPLLWEIALGHDLLEDTECVESILNLALRDFDYSVIEAITIRRGIVDLTDIYTKEEWPTFNRTQRKRSEAIRLGRIEPQHQSVKYADLIHNTQSIVECDPSFAKVYLQEKKQLLDRMRQGNIDLFIKCCWTLETASKLLL